MRYFLTICFAFLVFLQPCFAQTQEGGGFSLNDAMQNLTGATDQERIDLEKKMADLRKNIANNFIKLETAEETEKEGLRTEIETWQQQLIEKEAEYQFPKHLPGVGTQLQGSPGDFTIFLQRLINGIAGVAAALAVVFLIQNSFNLVIATGSSDDIAKAKKGVIWSLVGLVVIIGAFIVVKTVISIMYSAEGAIWQEATTEIEGLY